MMASISVRETDPAVAPWRTDGQVQHRRFDSHLGRAAVEDHFNSTGQSPRDMFRGPSAIVRRSGWRSGPRSGTPAARIRRGATRVRRHTHRDRRAAARHHVLRMPVPRGQPPASAGRARLLRESPRGVRPIGDRRGTGPIRPRVNDERVVCRPALASKRLRATAATSRALAPRP